MRIEVQHSFEKDIASISNKEIAIKVIEIIKRLEDCRTLSEIAHLKKIKGANNYYRIRVGNYRLGLKANKDTLILLRFMDRKDIYNYFP